MRSSSHHLHIASSLLSQLLIFCSKSQHYFLGLKSQYYHDCVTPNKRTWIEKTTQKESESRNRTEREIVKLESVKAGAEVPPQEVPPMSATSATTPTSSASAAYAAYASSYAQRYAQLGKLSELSKFKNRLQKTDSTQLRSISIKKGSEPGWSGIANQKKTSNRIRAFRPLRDALDRLALEMIFSRVLTSSRGVFSQNFGQLFSQ